MSVLTTLQRYYWNNIQPCLVAWKPERRVFITKPTWMNKQNISTSEFLDDWPATRCVSIDQLRLECFLEVCALWTWQNLSVVITGAWWAAKTAGLKGVSAAWWMDNDRPGCQYVPRSNLLHGHYHSLRPRISLEGKGGVVRRVVR